MHLSIFSYGNILYIWWGGMGMARVKGGGGVVEVMEGGRCSGGGGGGLRELTAPPVTCVYFSGPEFVDIMTLNYQIYRSGL